MLLGELMWRLGENAEATTWLSRANAELAPALATQQNKDAYRLLPPELHLLLGGVAAQRGDDAAAQAAWSIAEQELREGTRQPAFDRLDLLVRVFLAQHRDATASPYLARLKASGYVPLYPWQDGPGTPATAESR